MKCITAFYNVATDDEIMEILDEIGIEEYSKIPRCQGKGLTTEPRLDSHGKRHKKTHSLGLWRRRWCLRVVGIGEQ